MTVAAHRSAGGLERRQAVAQQSGRDPHHLSPAVGAASQRSADAFHRRRQQPILANIQRLAAGYQEFADKSARGLGSEPVGKVAEQLFSNEDLKAAAVPIAHIQSLRDVTRDLANKERLEIRYQHHAMRLDRPGDSIRSRSQDVRSVDAAVLLTAQALPATRREHKQL
jgi:hypothetical protein